MKVVIVQYAGDYREAVQRISRNGEETYYAQRYSVDAVADLAEQFGSVTVICCLTSTPYDEMLDNGVRAIGCGFSEPVDQRELGALVAKQNPDRLIIRTPMAQLLQWAASQPVPTIAVLADSFSLQGLRNRMRSYRYSRLLNHKAIEWVFNHGLNSCISLQSIGVSPDKIIPWDWPALVVPDLQPKALAEARAHTILFAGLVTAAKGIGDLLDAVAKLNQFDIRLRIAGSGDIEKFAAQATDLNIAEKVRFLGLLPHATILSEMRLADVVVVPSRHEYAEGFPMTIYETLCARTPLIASDHPMFRSNLTHELDSLIFNAGDSAGLAAALSRLLSEASLYSRLSTASAETWTRLQIPVKWAEAVKRWLTNSPQDRQWLFDHRWSSGLYSRSHPISQKVKRASA